MRPAEVLEQLGGVARRRTLLRWVSRGDLARALEVGDVIAVGRQRCGLPDADLAVRTAARLGGIVGLTSAALHHGWAVKSVPPLPHVVLSRGCRIPASAPPALVHRAELGDGEVDGHWTSEETTLEHCLRRLPFDEALCVADSALREGVGRDVLDRLADRVRGPGAVQVRRVAGASSPLAANPFESTARAISLAVPGLELRAQVVLPELGYRADLVDETLRIVVECDSFTWHGSRDALAADCRRYNAMVSHGWLVLRLCWEDVMFHPDAVHELLEATLVHAQMLSKGLTHGGAAA